MLLQAKLQAAAAPPSQAAARPTGNSLTPPAASHCLCLPQVFDVAAVRAALEQRLKSLELELHQVERLQRKFAMIHSTLAQQQSGAKGDPDTPKLRQSEENPLNNLSRSSLPPGAAAKVGGSCGGSGCVSEGMGCGEEARRAQQQKGQTSWLTCPPTQTRCPYRRPRTWARRVPS